MKYTGAMFENAVRSCDISITVLARKLHVNRRTIYNWFERDIVSMDVIYRAAKVIGTDFFQNFPGLELAGSRSRRQSALLSEDAEFWKTKYMQLLEQYNELLLKTRQAS